MFGVQCSVTCSVFGNLFGVRSLLNLSVCVRSYSIMRVRSMRVRVRSSPDERIDASGH